jgi:dihydrofolate reductase
MIHMIWAEARGGVIGAKGGIPWDVPGEQAHFRERTYGATVVMGRATWESLPASVRPLPGRRNVVLTRSPTFDPFGVGICWSIEELLQLHDDFWVIGGAAVYSALEPYADHIVRTRIELDVAGDAYAPKLGPRWQVVTRKRCTALAGSTQYTVEDLKPDLAG